MKRFSSSVAVLIVLLCASALLARPGVLKTKAGQTYNGDISDLGDSYTVTVDKVDTQIAKADVASVNYSGSIDEQFADRMQKLDAKDANGRVAVARFAFDNNRYDLTIQALSAAIQIDPNNADALDMLKTVQAQQALEHGKSGGSIPPAGGFDSGTPQPPVAPPTAIAKHLLTAKDINSIRQHEIKPGEDIPISIPADVRRKFAASIGVNYNDFNAMAPGDQLTEILAKGDAATKAAVKIGRDPSAIADFKRSIQPMVLRNCATSACHAGSGGGSFILYTGTDEATTYTNFYIMEQFSQKTTANAGFFGSGGQRKLIERGNGAHSLLVNFGIPMGQGDISHPKVPNSNFNGIFRSRDDRLCQGAVDWMDHGLNLFEPDYGINYTPPTAPTSQPATAP